MRTGCPLCLVAGVFLRLGMLSFGLLRLGLLGLGLLGGSIAAFGQTTTYGQTTADRPAYGPYSGVFLAGGDGLEKPLTANDPLFGAQISLTGIFGTDAPWTMRCWVRPSEPLTGTALIAGLGDPRAEYSRYFAIEQGKLALRMGAGNTLTSPAPLTDGAWHLLAATFEAGGVNASAMHLFLDGKEVAHGPLALGTVSPVLEMAPAEVPGEPQHFAGEIAYFTVERTAAQPAALAETYQHPPDFSLAAFEPGSPAWPIQTRGQPGQTEPQDPATLPRSAASFAPPHALPQPARRATLESTSPHHWTLAHNWRLIPAPKVTASPAQISAAGFATTEWMHATVPGTVLTTMVDRGIYPDPDYGLNNLAIPETLNKQDYWYRTEFTAPKLSAGRRLTLTFNGINYAAAIWLNGHQLGTIRGAFIRGNFDVTDSVRPGQANALAVRISPPPHPGLPHEQSILGGAGENGGIMVLDGPTFVATEGWDWIPGIRDRDSGLWQDVTLTETGLVAIGDAQVVTSPPLPDTSRAEVEITVPLKSTGTAPVQGEVKASFEQVTVTKAVTLQPGDNLVKLAPAEFPQLAVAHPRLWWPNGYGKPELYHLSLSFSSERGESDSKQARFGMREITYELSLLDSAGHLRRVELSPTDARQKDERVVDVSHEGMRKIPGGWVASLRQGAEASPAVHAIEDVRASPFLVIKLNGVRIACRGGNWGMDDARKRVSRERLEPYFRLHREANLNIIRNWVGQSTEETFFDLADEYGLLVWNDFWDSTQNYNLEPADPQLFLENARDTISHFRNHPSIVLWCGRNEGVPPPKINEGLTDLIRSLDGTRYYSPSSNTVNLQLSGPYTYQDPALYFTTLNRGFSVETGTQSMSTLEAFRRAVPKSEEWPVTDTWAYHDWHQRGNGSVQPFMHEVETEFGAATSLEDFERKAQMLNYVDHRAIFEGFGAHLWSPNSGRMLWMTEPAWPSNMWQILSSDYDTQASFYGVKKACEPVHVQLNLPGYDTAVVNTTNTALTGLTLSARVYSLENRLLLEHEQRLDVPADAVTAGSPLAIAPLLEAGMVFVRLELKGGDGQQISDNLYWLAKDSAGYRQLNALAPATLSATATATRSEREMHVRVELQNRGQAAALANKLTLLNGSTGAQILPAYLSDNYVSLLPGESRTIDVAYPLGAANGTATVAIRGWNLAPFTVAVAAGK